MGAARKMRTRRNEPDKTIFRSGRIFSANGEWFFETREGVNHGPFATRAEAERHLASFLREVGAGGDPTTRDHEEE